MKFPLLMLGCFVAGMLMPVSQAAAQAGLSQGKGRQEDQRLVIGTRFVRGGTDSTSPKRLFESHRVPLSDFNAADHCIDRTALAVAQDYFQAFGWKFAQTGFYYPIPDKDVERIKDTCSVGQEEAPKAFAVPGTTIIAFGTFVPKQQAQALMEKLR